MGSPWNIAASREQLALGLLAVLAISFACSGSSPPDRKPRPAANTNPTLSDEVAASCARAQTAPAPQTALECIDGVESSIGTGSNAFYTSRLPAGQHCWTYGEVARALRRACSNTRSALAAGGQRPQVDHCSDQQVVINTVPSRSASGPTLVYYVGVRAIPSMSDELSCKFVALRYSAYATVAVGDRVEVRSDSVAGRLFDGLEQALSSF